MPCHTVVVVNSIYLYVSFYFLYINLFSKSNYGLFEQELKKRLPVPAQKKSRCLRTPDFGRAGTGPNHARLEILCLLGPGKISGPKSYTRPSRNSVSSRKRIKSPFGNFRSKIHCLGQGTGLEKSTGLVKTV